jgi:AcrR family transcriptional regulator
MVRPAEPGRRALLDAGGRLLASQDLARLSVNAIVAEANMAKGSFYQHWATRRDYVVALHRRFHDQLAEAVAVAMEPFDPGRERLTVGMTAYLDGCLAASATKALLVQARTYADLGDEVARRNKEFARIATADLEVLGWRPAEPIATLLVAAVAEVALHELTSGRRGRTLRNAVLRLATRTPSAPRS